MPGDPAAAGGRRGGVPDREQPQREGGGGVMYQSAKFFAKKSKCKVERLDFLHRLRWQNAIILIDFSHSQDGPFNALTLFVFYDFRSFYRQFEKLDVSATLIAGDPIDMSIVNAKT